MRPSHRRMTRKRRRPILSRHSPRQPRRPRKPSEASGPDAARSSVNAPVKGEVKPAPKPGTAPLENSASPRKSPGKGRGGEEPEEKTPAEKSR